MRKKHHSGFTLFEMSLVLLVISLVITGVLAARSMIRTAQIQTAMSEFQMYSGAVKNFKSKYLALPGDFSTAATLWGEVSGSCKVGSATGTLTCNGNGNGIIEFDGTNYEHIAAWRHLGLSGFINQNHTGNTFGGSVCTMDIKPGDNAPASKLKGAVWNIGSSVMGTAYTTGVAGTQYIPMVSATDNTTLQVLWLGGSLQDDNGQTASCAGSQIPVFTGQEAYEIDKKYDDMRAGYGKIRGQYNNTATYQTCEDAGSSFGNYRTDATGINCSLAFIINP